MNTESFMNRTRLNVNEAAHYLGLQPDTLYQWRKRGAGIPSYKVRNKVLYNKSDLDEYRANH